LVFCPYTKVRGAICILAPLQASIRLSLDFTLPWHRSSAF
jgi:hypothetical protein